MSSKLVLLGLVCLAAVVLADHEHKFKCLGTEVVATDGQTKGVKDCMEEAKARKGTGAPAGGHKGPGGMDPCLMACMLSKDGSIKDGKLDTDVINKGIDASYPEAARAGLKKDWAACSSSITETLSTDNNCKSYEALGECLTKATMSNCKIKGQ